MPPSPDAVNQLIRKLRDHIRALERDPLAIVRQQVNPYGCHQKIAELETLLQRCEDTARLLHKLQIALSKACSEASLLLTTHPTTPDPPSI